MRCCYCRCCCWWWWWRSYYENSLVGIAADGFLRSVVLGVAVGDGPTMKIAFGNFDVVVIAVAVGGGDGPTMKIAFVDVAVVIISGNCDVVGACSSVMYYM